MNTIYKSVALFVLFLIAPNVFSQNADPGIGILMTPASLTIGTTGILSANVGNYGNSTIVANSLRVTISVGTDAEIIGIAPGSDSRWTMMSMTTGSGNTIRLKNTAGGFSSFDVGDILLTIRANVISGPDLILGNIVYITAANPLLCGVCPPTPLNVSQGNASTSNDNSQTSLAVTFPLIDAVVDITTPVNGTVGGTTPSLTANDTLNGSPVVIGTAPGNVTLTAVSVPTGLTLNPNGTVTIAPNTPAGTYSVQYTICEVTNPTNCDTVTSSIVVVSTDFTPTIDIDNVVFLTAGVSRDFVVNISEIGAGPSVGQLVFKLPKQSAFTITYNATATTSDVNGGTSVNNGDWIITENSLFVTVTLKPNMVIGLNSFSSIGFSISRKVNVPNQTWQPLTATIINGSGADSESSNNSYNVIVKAQ